MARHSQFSLTEEQQNFIDKALSGKNILVDACIGSGKTTAIQRLCNKYDRKKSILYLTYNKLLKIDAKNKIWNKNVYVQNYHGYCYCILRDINVFASPSVVLKMFLETKPEIPSYDVLILDEYQDVDEDISEVLQYIKSYNPCMQIIAVGDMEQKIYDFTTLNVLSFIHDFLGDYEKLEFTKCFRLSKEFAAKLGRIWKKNIIGVNKNFSVEEMDKDEIVQFLYKQKPKDIICLGSSGGMRDVILNILENSLSKVFNKNTVYAKISDKNSGNIKPSSDSAIFTTYDSSKGLEKRFLILCDFNERYWELRTKSPTIKYEIIRNIFCVAASRGKEKVIILKKKEKPKNDNLITNEKEDKDKILTEQILSTPTETNYKFKFFEMSSMFYFKFQEHLQQCYQQLHIEEIKNIENHNVPIYIKNQDGLIDLSPCIGIYQEAFFFSNYDIDKEIFNKLSYKYFMEMYNQSPNKSMNYLMSEAEKRADEIMDKNLVGYDLDQRILFLTSIETHQERYIKQVKTPFVTQAQKARIKKRLKTIFKYNESVQNECKLSFSIGNEQIEIRGISDVIKDNVVYELKFVGELSIEHYLQCATYIVAHGLEKGILWNTKNNTMYSITVPNKKEFLNCMVRTITKDSEYSFASISDDEDILSLIPDLRIYSQSSNSQISSQSSNKKRQYEEEEDSLFSSSPIDLPSQSTYDNFKNKKIHYEDENRESSASHSSHSHFK